MKPHFAAFLVLFALSGAVWAHEGEHHILGKVTAVSANSITVETAGKEMKVVTVLVGAQTKFLKSGSSVSLKDLKVGDRVVIYAKARGDKLEASPVSFGKPKPSPK